MLCTLQAVWTRRTHPSINTTRVRRLTADSWFQDATAKECGLHSGNVVQSAADQARDELPDLWPSGPVEALSRQQLAALKDGPRDKDTLVVLYAPWCQFSQVCRPSYSIDREFEHCRAVPQMLHISDEPCRAFTRFLPMQDFTNVAACC